MTWRSKSTSRRNAHRKTIFVLTRRAHQVSSCGNWLAGSIPVSGTEITINPIANPAAIHRIWMN